MADDIPDGLEYVTPSILPRLSPPVRFTLGLFILPAIAVGLYVFTLNADQLCTDEETIYYTDGRTAQSGGCYASDDVVAGSAHSAGAGLAFAATLWVDAHTRTPGQNGLFTWLRRLAIVGSLGVALAALYFDWPLWVGLAALLFGPVIVGLKAIYGHQVRKRRAAAAGLGAAPRES